MTFGRMTLGRMTLGRMTLGRMTLGRMTLGRMTGNYLPKIILFTESKNSNRMTLFRMPFQNYHW
jgi:hypothetical protein